MRLFLAGTITLLLAGASQITAQPKGPPTNDPRPMKKGSGTAQAGSLESLIAEALKNNPDVRVAESRIKESEAMLNRGRMQVVVELSTLYAEIQVAEAMVAEAKARHEAAKRLVDVKAMSAEEDGAGQLTLGKVKADLAVKQPKLPFLLGRPVAGQPTTGSLDALIMKKAIEIGLELNKGPALTDE